MDVRQPSSDDEILLEEIADHLNSSLHISTDDVMKELSSLGVSLSEAIPQLNYAGFSAYSILIPEILAILKTGISLPQPQAIGAAWNIADAVLQIVSGSFQIYSAVTKDTHKSISTGIEGGVNIGSGTQLIVLTALSASLGAIGFAVAFGVATACSMKNTIESARKSLDDDFWIKDSLEILTLSRKKQSEELKARHEQIGKMKKKVGKSLEEQKPQNIDDIAVIEEIKRSNDRAAPDEKLPPETLNLVTDVMLHFIRSRLEESENNIQDLQTEIFARLITDYVKKGNNSYLCKNEVDFSQFTESQQKCLIDFKIGLIQTEPKTKEIRKQNRNERINQANKILKKECKNPSAKGLLTSYDESKKMTKQSKDKCRKETIIKAIDTLYIAMAFAGMVCLCIPGAQPFAPFLIAPAAAYFTAKYSVQIVSAIKSIHSFFKNKKEYHDKEMKNQQQQYPDKTTKVEKKR